VLSASNAYTNWLLRLSDILLAHSSMSNASIFTAAISSGFLQETQYANNRLYKCTLAGRYTFSFSLLLCSYNHSGIDSDCATHWILPRACSHSLHMNLLLLQFVYLLCLLCSKLWLRMMYSERSVHGCIAKVDFSDGSVWVRVGNSDLLTIQYCTGYLLRSKWLALVCLMRL
jgi:hypothetical protein